GIPMRDLTSGFRAMRRRVMLDFLHLLPNQFSWPTTSALAFAKAGFHVRFEPIVVRKRETGRSSQKLVRNGIRFLLIIMRMSVLFSPLRVFGGDERPATAPAAFHRHVFPRWAGLVFLRAHLRAGGEPALPVAGELADRRAGARVNRRARWLTRLFGPAVLAYFLLTTDLHRIAANLREVRWTPLVLSLVLFAGLVLTKAWRWRVLLQELDVATPTLREACTLFMIGQFAGGATPGQTGDFVRAWYLRERGAPLSAALFSILIDRLLDFFLLAILSLFGLVAFLDIFPAAVRPAILVSTVGFAIA